MTRFRSFLADESGTATIEFLFVFPIVMTIFLASFEASLFTIRSVMLERSVDMVVRQIRLGIIDDNVKAEPFKRLICGTSALVTSVNDCIDSMSIWMQPISTTNWVMDPPDTCLDRNMPPEPDLEDDTGALRYGTDNEIVLLWICLKEDPMFPTSPVAAGMTKDHADGNYALLVTSVFVREPG